ncbi:Myc-type, basic helix-loop-helix (bHLH) domain containing protein [Parasponia andersonii]|uniref:Myc-type, basic helix-loop-helix (BHLH) domain containing protein n=1 Tax=Parasponia andersonii TaxID=3476 RepID=A0A2P5CXN6_PARAD|nr:Myc-type, basic helix-loop-helix (bHLH) domain containing protein [Parasponia andersonii]
MEGESSQNNIDFVGNTGNDVGLGPEDDLTGHVLMGSGTGTSWNQSDAVRLPWWVQVQVQPQETSHSYVHFLAESSSGTPSEDMLHLESLPSPKNGTTYGVSGVSDFQEDMPYNHHMGLAWGYKPTEMDAWKLGALMAHNEDMDNESTSTQHQIHAQNLSSWSQNSDGESYSSRVDISPSARVASPGSLSKFQSSASKQRNYRNDRAFSKQQRRMRFAERVNAFQELLPHSTEGCQVSVLDDVIDHIKHLQLQIKDLCKRRVEGESPTWPIIFREGYGHYFCDQDMLNEPFEEMVAKLLELNPLAATKLLEMNGLLLMPIELTKGLI